MKKILIWHQGTLGDMILSLPAINAIRHYEGPDHIHLLARTDLSFIITDRKLTDELSSCDDGIFANLFSDAVHMPAGLRAFLEGFNKAFVFMRKVDNIFLENMRAHIPATFLIHSVPAGGVRSHVSLYQLEQIKSASGCCRNEPPVMPHYLSGGAAPGEKKVIAIHPGSGGRKKCWPLDKYLELAEMFLSRQDCLIKFLCGPAEDDGTFNKIRSFIDERGINAVIVRDRPLREIGALLSTASLYIGNDSGISHLASVTGVPGIVIFGPTDHEIWRPLGRNMTVVRSGVPCSPCGQDIYINCHDQGCLTGIDAAKVFITTQCLSEGP